MSGHPVEKTSRSILLFQTAWLSEGDRFRAWCDECPWKAEASTPDLDTTSKALILHKTTAHDWAAAYPVQNVQGLLEAWKTEDTKRPPTER